MTMPPAQRQTPVYGWYGDDFTGATDTLATLALRGVGAFLFLDPPDASRLAAIGPVEAVGMASAARSLEPQAMRDLLAPAGAFLAEAGVRLVHYKCCSTFDSAPQTGNIAVAMQVLAQATGAGRRAVLGGQPSLGRYCAFGNLFASAGTGGEVWRLDRHPTMSRHPATPMHEADLRRHFSALGLDGVALAPWTALAAASLQWPEGDAPVLFDALDESHIAAIGACLHRETARGTVLVAGASSVAEAFFHDRPADPERLSRPLAAPDGPVLAVAGSLSPLSARQVAAASGYDRMAVLPAQIIGSDTALDAVAAQVAEGLQQGRNMLVSTAPGTGGATSAAHAAQAADGDLAGATARLVARILDRVPVRRLAIAGGDTSSRIVQGLGLWGLSYGWRHAPGVAVSLGRSDDSRRDGMQLLLKGGQMGSDDIFDRFASDGRQP